MLTIKKHLEKIIYQFFFYKNNVYLKIFLGIVFIICLQDDCFAIHCDTPEPKQENNSEQDENKDENENVSKSKLFGAFMAGVLFAIVLYREYCDRFP